MKKPVLAIPLGDPGGIGPEVVFKALCHPEILRRSDCLVIGATSVLDSLRNVISSKLTVHQVGQTVLPDLQKKAVNFLNIEDQAAEILRRIPESRRKRFLKKGSGRGFESGKVSLLNAAIAHASIRKASELAGNGFVQGIVTAPVNKTAMRLIDPAFQGHTEFLARRAGVKSFAMMFVSHRLKVTLVTIHVPLKKVSGLIRPDKVLEKISLTHRFLREKYGIIKPRIAVCALNPHGSETGTEEKTRIVPAVESAKRKGIQVTGPLSADQLFHDAYEERYDAVISMYHDQGLAPFKMIAFHDGVNVTLGLPFVRTSPDHGTAFDIAYRGRADERSMVSAIQLAQKLLTPKTRKTRS